MAPFGDGGGGGGGGAEDEGGRDARRGWDPLRSGSAPPTMEGSAAAALAAEGLFGGGGGHGTGSFFSGTGGLGARLDEVSKQRGVIAQVGDVLGPCSLSLLVSLRCRLDWVSRLVLACGDVPGFPYHCVVIVGDCRRDDDCCADHSAL